jgi:N-hydroxyarylamine O-acetyltransferase
MDIDAYLDRVGYMGSRDPTAKTLRELQLAHLTTVPFENLSIHAGEPIVLGDEPLFEKIVGRRRGGFCYELNGLFAGLLRDLGFNVSMLSARVARGDGVFSEEFDHMTLLVSLEERWLADVGFGDTFREPLQIDETAAQLQDGGAYRIEKVGDRRVLSERGAGGGWEAQYSFSLEPHEYADYADRCHYQQTSPQSNFTGCRLCTRATPDGRLTLSDMRFISTTLAGDRRERELKNEAEAEQLLREEFGIVMGRPLNPAG